MPLLHDWGVMRWRSPQATFNHDGVLFQQDHDGKPIGSLLQVDGHVRFFFYEAFLYPFKKILNNLSNKSWHQVEGLGLQIGLGGSIGLFDLIFLHQRLVSICP